MAYNKTKLLGNYCRTFFYCLILSPYSVFNVLLTLTQPLEDIVDWQ